MSPPPRPLLVVAALFAVYVIWGSTYLAILVAVRDMPVFAMGAIRFLIAAVLLLGLALVRKEPWPDPVQWRGGLLAGWIFLGVSNTAVMLGERTVPSGMTALVCATAPLWITLIESRLKDGEKPSGATLGGMALGFGGVTVLMLPTLTTPRGPALLDLALVFGGPMIWAIGTSFSRRHPMPATPFMGSAIQALAAGGFDFAVAMALGEPALLVAHPPGLAAWQAVAYLVVFGSGVAFTSFAWLVRTVPPSLSSSNSYVNPVVAVVLGAILLGEAVTGWVVAGTALVVLAVFLLSAPVIRRRASA